MPYPISGIRFNEDDFKDFHFIDLSHENDHTERIIRNLNKINFFVGENNSGKSLLLRKLFFQTFENMSISPNIVEGNLDWQKDLNQIKELIEKLHNQIHDSKFPSSLNSNLKTLKSAIEGLILNEYNATKEDFFNDIEHLAEKFVSPDKKYLKSFNDFTSPQYAAQNSDFEEIFNQIRSDILEIEALSKKYKEVLSKKNEFHMIYIPVLRGTKPLVGENETQKMDFYCTRFCSDYLKEVNKTTADQIEKSIFTGLNIYEESKRQLLGNLHDRKLFRDYEIFLSKYFFENEGITLIPSHDKDVLSIKIGNEKEQPIYKVGDGLQSIIVMTYPLFLHRNGTNLVFYEEPENNMHPGLQRKFIESLSSGDNFNNSQFFIVTHSNHFLDLTLDCNEISVYTVEKEKDSQNSIENSEILPKFKIQNVSHGKMETLQLLGVQNSSVFLCNRTIWVEGITDRIYIRRFLELYMTKKTQKKVYEDVDYAFIEYSGNNITHWSFLDTEDDEESDCPEEKRINYKAITQNIFLITDRDKGKEQRHEKLKKYLGEKQYYCFDSLEIENSFSKDMIVAIVKKHFKPECNTESEQWSQLTKTRPETFETRKLGKLIYDKLGPELGKTFYKKKGSGTIKDKMKFCKVALELLKDFDDLSDEQKGLTEKIYDFIAQKA